MEHHSDITAEAIYEERKKKAYHMLLTIIDMLDEESNLQTPVLQVSGNGQTVVVHMDISMVIYLSHCFVHFVHRISTRRLAEPLFSLSCFFTFYNFFLYSHSFLFK